LSANLNPSNRPVRTRMPGGVAGDVEPTPRPYADFVDGSGIAVGPATRSRLERLYIFKPVHYVAADLQVLGSLL
jgi:hypothetical protein